MANMIKQLILKETENSDQAVTLICNYADNYYGDQLCRVVDEDKQRDD